MTTILLVVLLGLVLLGVLVTVGRRLRNWRKIDLNLAGHRRYLASVAGRCTRPPATASDSPAPPASPAPPNFVVFFMDDLGFGDIGCYGATNVATPNIDRLAREGLKFETAYSSSPVCSPSRAGMLTGRHPLRMHVPNVFFPAGTWLNFFWKCIGMYSCGVEGLLPDEITIAEALQSAGYATGLLGKWHLGSKSPHFPNEHGFDFFYGAHYSNDMKPYAIWRNREIAQPAPADQDHLTQALTREGVQFIRDHQHESFFLLYCQPFPHVPLHASEAFRGTSKAGLYGDAVQEADWSIGEILRVLEETGTRANTLVLFTSDNGPWHEGNPGYHRGRKGLPYEGGQRVPLIATWPDHIPHGTTTTEMVMNVDFFPTILAAAGLPVPADRVIDGKNLLPLMTGETTTSPHDYLLYHWGKRFLAIRDREYKYHARHRSDNSTYVFSKVGPMLFDMTRYDQESYDQRTHHPTRAEALHAQLLDVVAEFKRNPRGWRPPSRDQE